MIADDLCNGRGSAARALGRVARYAVSIPVMLSLVSSQIALAQSLPTNTNEIPSGSPVEPTTERSSDPSPSSSRSSPPAMDSTIIQPVTVSGQGRVYGTEDKAEQRRMLEAGSSDLLDARNPRLKPPADPNEYEKWILEVTGRDLKRFGSDLLLPSNRDYAVPATSAIPPDYALNIGDVISVAMTGSIEGSADFEIDRNGNIDLPNVGTVKVAGVRYRDLKDRIAAAIGRQYRGFEVSVSMRQLRGVRVYVTGFANNPGAYTVNSLSTLVNAVLAAGGPSAGGSFRSVKLYRNGAEVADFDLYELVRRGNKSRDPLLQNEDVLFIPPVGRQVAVIGSVNEEAIYESLPGESVEDTLRLAGGPNTLADASRVVLYRLRDRDTSWSRQLTRAEAARELAEAGDIVQILSEGSLSRPLDRQSTIVRIEGEVNRPGNYYVSPGTPLSTVLEMAGGVTPRAFVYGTKLMRDSVRAQQREGYREAINQMEMILAAAPLTQDQLTNPTERQTQLASFRAFIDRLRKAEPDGRLILDLKPEMTDLPGNIVMENNDRIVVPPRVETVGVFGAVYRPASFMLGVGKPMKVGAYIDQAGGTLRAADRGNIFVVRANGEVVTKKRGALSAYAVPGDVVFVPVKTQSTSLLAKIRDITAIIFQFGLTAAAIAAID